jgi:predicted 2-oxoglutarate/Fe(II)-dependent dioxygenase YbiX
MKTHIADYIKVKNCIPAKECESLIANAKTLQWSKHAWYDPATEQTHSEDSKEPNIAPTSSWLQTKAIVYVNDALASYMDDFKDKSIENPADFITTSCPVRFNHYPAGSLMRPHHDHIHSIFDGRYKGIPVLSIVGLLNDNFKGGELVFFGNHEVKLAAGNIVVFPSNFMYRHEVREILEGDRFSFVAWAF